MPKLKRLSHSALKDVVLSRRQHFVASKREQNGLSVWAKELGLPLATVKNDRFKGYEVVPKRVSSCHGAPVTMKIKRVKLPPEPPVNGTKPKPRYEYRLGDHLCMKCGKSCTEV